MLFNMLKLFVLGVILCQGMCERPDDSDDSSMPLLGEMSSVDVNGSTVEIPELKGHYFYSPHQTIYINAPSAWKWPTNLGNASTKFRVDYTVATSGVEAHKVNIRKLSWNQARKVCIDEGGHLADIRTIEEMNAIKALMFAKSVDYAWVGFHDLFEEGDWVSVLEEPLGKMQWSPWSSRYSPNPDNTKGNENCAGFMSKYDGLNDDNCGEQLPFVCKISIQRCEKTL